MTTIVHSEMLIQLKSELFIECVAWSWILVCNHSAPTSTVYHWDLQTFSSNCFQLPLPSSLFKLPLCLPGISLYSLICISESRLWKFPNGPCAVWKMIYGSEPSCLEQVSLLGMQEAKEQITKYHPLISMCVIKYWQKQLAEEMLHMA